MRIPKNRHRAALAALPLAVLLSLAGCGGQKPQDEAKAPPVAEPKPGEAGTEPLKEEVKPFAGYRAADFTAVDVFTGEKIRLADLRGQVVFLNFWATWCPPCKAEMPEMEALHQELGDKVRIIALGADAREPGEKMGAFANSLGLTFTIAFDQASAAKAYQVAGVPTSFFIDKEGIISARHSGPMNLETMKQYIAEAGKVPTEKQ